MQIGTNFSTSYRKAVVIQIKYTPEAVTSSALIYSRYALAGCSSL